MDPLIASLTTTALTEGVKFLYSQASEMLKGWRERRRNPDAPGPRVLEPPKEVTLRPAKEPLAEPADRAMEDTLTDLRDAVEKIKDGEVSVDAPEARRAIGLLREYLEQLTGASITFEGEDPRELRVRDVRVQAERIQGNVRGVVADLDKLTGSATIEHVTAEGKDVKGDVEGVRLT